MFYALHILLGSDELVIELLLGNVASLARPLNHNVGLLNKFLIDGL